MDKCRAGPLKYTLPASKNALTVFWIGAAIPNVLFDSCHGLAKGGSCSVVSEVIIVSAVS